MNRTLKRDITDEQMRAYDEDGVVLIRGALDEEELCPILGDGVIRRRREFWFRRSAYRL